MESRDEVTFDEPDMDLELEAAFETEETSDATLVLDLPMTFPRLAPNREMEAAYETEETSDATLVLDSFEVLEGDCSSTSFIFTKASKGSKSDQLNIKDTVTTEAVKGRQID